MIHLELSKAEALLAFELFKANTDALLEQIMDKVDAEVTNDSMVQTARENYVANLEAEVKNLQALIDAKNIASESNKIYGKPAKKKTKPKAPWGYKKDGTPKKRPGRAPGDF